MSKYDFEKEGYFEVMHSVKFKNLCLESRLPKSDLSLQTKNRLLQLKYVQGSGDTAKVALKGGIFTLQSSQAGLNCVPVDLTKRRLMVDAINTKILIDEAEVFFNNLDVYEELEKPKKRGVLMYSSPGLGKTSTISHFCTESVKTDPGTVVLVWPTGQIDADAVLNFFSTRVEYAPECTRLVLIIEDIGGNERENYGSPRGVDEAMLNLLDGVSVSFKLPTFIIATTNHPENMMASLADRPGRFDLMVELKAPPVEERLKLLEFIAKRQLTQEEKDAFSTNECNDLSIAHLDEIVVRSRLHRKPLEKCLRELLDHSKLVKNQFEAGKAKVGFADRGGLWD